MAVLGSRESPDELTKKRAHFLGMTVEEVEAMNHQFFFEWLEQAEPWEVEVVLMVWAKGRMNGRTG